MGKRGDFDLKLWLLLVLILVSKVSIGQQKQVCVSFDDLPFVSYKLTDSTLLEDSFRNLVFALKSYKIPAIGFVNEQKLYENGMIINSRLELLNHWIKNGLELGNHTYSHKDYNTIPLSVFSQDILKGGIVTSKILQEKNKMLKYFRHPFLHAGNSKAKADSLTNFLLDHSYIVAPVTMDNDDYLFASAYEKSMINNDSILMLQIGHDYLTYTEAKLKYYERQTQKLFERNINQILLLHASYLNSCYLDSLVLLFQKNGYDFIKIDEALKDEVYKTEITRFGNWGISWIDRWALSKGEKGDFFKEEPTVPEYINRASNQK